MSRGLKFLRAQKHVRQTQTHMHIHYTSHGSSNVSCRCTKSYSQHLWDVWSVKFTSWSQNAPHLCDVVSEGCGLWRLRCGLWMLHICVVVSLNVTVWFPNVSRRMFFASFNWHSFPLHAFTLHAFPWCALSFYSFQYMHFHYFFITEMSIML